ncbi:hypothetical protein ASPWEDRAFT_397677 [Aspergillus wentii DTO 134E9]|uniref:Uncharacterized protein n=1 Tax=Aspergillus wentii DTO 134E9 TaxID=1073089 RepID=A0A1L9RY50_ASPWE|nr:uncharacterized protein ASPWEDRAFT_397677 [Aspergillus wentii DTO 134E9]OJJ39849.1 hypothetical protein ASPWEDRAFT_397677 [Aspergillus wentii DTO 134E9]
MVDDIALIPDLARRLQQTHQEADTQYAKAIVAQVNASSDWASFVSQHPEIAISNTTCISGQTWASLIASSYTTTGSAGVVGFCRLVLLRQLGNCALHWKERSLNVLKRMV